MHSQDSEFPNPGLREPEHTDPELRLARGTRERTRSVDPDVRRLAEDAGRVLLSDPGGSGLPDETILVKHRHDTCVIARDGLYAKARRLSSVGRLRAAAGRSPLHRRLAGARKLRLAGIDAERVVGLVRLKSPTACLVLVTEAVAGSPLLEVLADGGAEERHRALAAAGELAGRVAVAGLRNRDAKPSNLIVGPERGSQHESIVGASASQPGPPSLTVIDCDGVRRSGRARAKALEQMLLALVLEPAGVGRPLSDDDLCVACSAGLKLLLGREPESHEIGRLTARVRAAERAHGDPTPRDNPRRPR